MLSKDITKLIGDAMKSHDAVRLSTLRMLSSAFNYAKIDLQHDLTDEEELVVIRKQAKERKDAIEAYTKAGSPERAESEQSELKILQEFLPPEMDEAELMKLVEQAIIATGASSMADMGKVIGSVKQFAPSVEGGRIAELVKAKLQ